MNTFFIFRVYSFVYYLIIIKLLKLFYKICFFLFLNVNIFAQNDSKKWMLDLKQDFNFDNQKLNTLKSVEIYINGTPVYKSEKNIKSFMSGFYVQNNKNDYKVRLKLKNNNGKSEILNKKYTYYELFGFEFEFSITGIKEDNLDDEFTSMKIISGY